MLLELKTQLLLETLQQLKMKLVLEARVYCFLVVNHLMLLLHEIQFLLQNLLRLESSHWVQDQIHHYRIPIQNPIQPCLVVLQHTFFLVRIYKDHGCFYNRRQVLYLRVYGIFQPLETLNHARLHLGYISVTSRLYLSYISLQQKKILA